MTTEPESSGTTPMREESPATACPRDLKEQLYREALTRSGVMTSLQERIIASDAFEALWNAKEQETSALRQTLAEREGEIATLKAECDLRTEHSNEDAAELSRLRDEIERLKEEISRLTLKAPSIQ